MVGLMRLKYWKDRGFREGWCNLRDGGIVGIGELQKFVKQWD